ncbi:MAG: ribonuclease H-like domain-containing protein, partial [Myxococcota bacterium]
MSSKLQRRLARFAGQDSARPESTKKPAKIAALQRKLDRLVVDGRRGLRFRETPEPSTALARLLRDAPALRELAPEDRHRALPGKRQSTPHGELHFVRQWLEPAHHHGRAPVEPARTASADLIARLALDRAFEDVDPQHMLLIDTETTGLSTGAGTLPFLVGVGFFEDASLCIEQMLLTQRSDEPALLRCLAERIESASCLVSYNGKSFDWPLLRSRFVLNRVPVPPLPPHL